MCVNVRVCECDWNAPEARVGMATYLCLCSTSPTHKESSIKAASERGGATVDADNILGRNLPKEFIIAARIAHLRACVMATRASVQIWFKLHTVN